MYMSHMKIHVRGKVQDVGYRAHAKREADSLGLQGFVRNEPDGSVFIEVEGLQEKLHDFLRWCHSGSPEAKVESVESIVHTLIGHTGFYTY